LYFLAHHRTKSHELGAGIHFDLAGLGGVASNGCRFGDNPALQSAHEKLLKDRSFQFEFTELPEPPEPPKWLEPLAEFLQFIAPLFKVIFWIGVIALIGGFLWLILREMLKVRWTDRSKKKSADKPELQIAQPKAGRAKVLLEEADRLAAEGKFSEAVHLLLFRSIQDIEKHLPGTVKRSQTSREIELMGSIPSHPRTGFERIRQAVEHSFFGRQSMDESEYQTCRNAYKDFAFSPEWP